MTTTWFLISMTSLDIHNQDVHKCYVFWTTCWPILQTRTAVTTDSCHLIWQTKWQTMISILAAEQRIVGWPGRPITTKQQSVVG